MAENWERGCRTDTCPSPCFGWQKRSREPREPANNVERGIWTPPAAITPIDQRLLRQSRWKTRAVESLIKTYALPNAEPVERLRSLEKTGGASARKRRVNRIHPLTTDALMSLVRPRIQEVEEKNKQLNIVKRAGTLQFRPNSKAIRLMKHEILRYWVMDERKMGLLSADGFGSKKMYRANTVPESMLRAPKRIAGTRGARASWGRAPRQEDDIYVREFPPPLRSSMLWEPFHLVLSRIQWLQGAEKKNNS
ncbi:hypothetical protein BDK51DRAFT_28436 [Blyttiomyces helicus]|uniref:Uncharacterized protein n=1 Tax=Blyttiomyces helicus TaxID=388810 RepID=A0A4P9WMC4_9FUNG|nr:hypothetical protein BDK51DRAFT_28436 [Blyttiomyces helicus]|eukprot:RKO94219.1 hypothetical protein BDK51DRAFT_28436 [Blyttiomyces helicus]